jgi:hypothetical protein
LTAAVDKIAPVSEAEKRALWRASFIRVFDRHMFNAIISPTTYRSEQPTFEKLSSLPGIERSTVDTDIYRVKDSVAVEHLQTWIEKDPQRREIRDVSEQAYKYMLMRNDNARRDETQTIYSAMDVLRFRLPISAEAGRALDEFNNLFETADNAFDLATCHALVQMLQELDSFQADLRTAELKLLNDQQRLRCDELIPYVSARGRFIEEFAKSAAFLEREMLSAKTDEFLKPKTDDSNQSSTPQADGTHQSARTGGDWLLPIFGRGGSGKTIFLQWLVARYAVPLRIPVAKVDFDDINIAKLGKHPVLVLLRFAEQLDRQIPYSPFRSLLMSYGKYASVLLPSPRIPKGLSVDGLERELDATPMIEIDIQAIFETAIWGRSAVLILDTVEEGVLHFPDALRTSIEVIRTLRENIPPAQRAFKLILSGRYNLAERGFLAPGDPEPFEVTAFSDREAEKYLLEFRRLDRPDLVPFIVRKAKGNPFILSLIADLVIAQGIRDRAAVEELKPEFAYLIQRVIDRIPESQFGVRWVVRYGVVPRRLTQQFLDSVMLPVLRDELAGAGRYDTLMAVEEKFQRGKIEESTLWTQLREYAAPNGWLRATSDDVRFQPEVVRPMRALLVKEGVHGILHHQAEKWFQAQAEDDKTPPELWASLKSEELYHACWVRAQELRKVTYARLLFLMNTPAQRLVAAISGVGRRSSGNRNTRPEESRSSVLRLDPVRVRLRGCLSDSRVASGAARRSLLEAVTGFVETDQTNSHPRIAAEVEGVISEQLVGWALLEWAKSAAGIAFGPCKLEEQPTNIRNAVALAKEFCPAREWSEVPERLIEMSLAVGERNYAHAAELKIDPQPTEDPVQLYSYYLLSARAFANIDSGEAETRYHLAWQILNQQRSTNWPVFELTWESARELARMGKLDRAIAAYRTAILEAKQQNIDLAAEAADVSLQLGDYAEARRLAPEDSFYGYCIGLLVDVAHGRLRLADVQSPDPSHVEPLVPETAGVLNAAWFNLNTAVSQLETAVSLYRQHGDSVRAERALLAHVRVLKDQVGNWARAERALEGVATNKSPALDLEAVHLRLLRGKEPKPETDLAKIFVALHEGVDPPRALRELLEILRKVQPESARYQYLRMFRHLPELEGVSDLKDEFIRLLSEKSDDEDFFAHAFDVIELFRCLEGFLAEGAQVSITGHDPRTDEEIPSAKYYLRAAEEKQSPDLFVLHRIIEAASKLGADLPDVDAVDTFVQRCGDHGLGFAVRAKHTAAVIERELTHEGLLGVADTKDVPKELQGTSVEVQNLMNRAALAPRDDIREEITNSAAQMLRALGQDAPARRLVAKQKADDTRGPSALSEKSDRVVIPLRTLPDPWDAPQQLGISIEHVRALLGSQHEAARSLRSALPENLRLKSVIELPIDETKLSDLPWEWAFPESAVCFRSCSKLRFKTGNPFAFLWSKAPEYLRRLGSSIWPVRVVVLRQPVAYQEQTRRGFDLVSRRPLKDIYKSHGVRVLEPEHLAQTFITKIFDEHRPTVIHIQAPIVQDEERTFVLDLPLSAEAEAGAAAPPFTADYLNLLLRSVQTTNPPLLILDPPRPVDDADVARQLLLRNRFAADFAELGNARAVLCTGLFERSVAQPAAERLALEISLTPRLDQLLLLCRRELGTDRFSAMGAALVAADPTELIR